MSPAGRLSPSPRPRAPITRWRALAALAVTALAPCAPARAAADPAPNSAPAPTPADVRSAHPAWDALAALARGRPAVDRYRAAYTQTKHSPLLNDPIVSTGQVQMAGGIARWETHPPHPTVMTLHGGALRLYYPQQHTVEVYDLGDRLDALATSPVPDLAVLREHFEPHTWNWPGGDAPFEMNLLPVSPTMRDAVESVAVVVDPQTGTLARFTLTDLDGETTEMAFSDAQLNPELDPESLKLALPPDTRVVRPLDAAAP